VGQILVVDIVFSLDSVITAVGLAQEVSVMIAAVVLAMLVMLWAAKPIGDFVNEHPTVKMLALSFLLMVGLMLVAEALGHHIPKGYIYFAMAFSFAVEMLNLRLRGKERPIPSNCIIFRKNKTRFLRLYMPCSAFPPEWPGDGSAKPWLTPGWDQAAPFSFSPGGCVLFFFGVRLEGAGLHGRVVVRVAPPRA